MVARTALSLMLFVTAASCVAAAEPIEPPLKKVVLFNSGVGYFEHETTVGGDVELELTFDRSDINDLLKSMVVQDLDGGRIKSVNYPSRRPLSEQLRRCSVDLTSQPTLAELLHQLRGEQVELDGGEVKGIVLGVELKPSGTGQQMGNREVLDLMTADGLRAVPLDSVGRVKLSDPELEAELRAALQLLVAGRQADKKTVHFRCRGNGRRTVRIGYVRETPIWKTSYRIVLEDDNRSLLQGWAILENTSEVDWNEVSLTLTSGRPVTFQMDLDRPLLVQRPVLRPKVPASLAARVYSPPLEQLDFDRPMVPGGVAGSQRPFVTSTVPVIGPGTVRGGWGGGGFGGGMGGMGGMGGGLGGGLGGGGFGGSGAGGAATAGQRGPAYLGGQEPGAGTDAPLAPSQGVVAQATAEEVGEQFRYHIARPVSLAQQTAALIPIVDQHVKTERRSVFTVDADSEHPRLAMRLTNTSTLRLMSGPITVFQDGAFAGDARVDYLRPGDVRLISYAQDLDLKIRHVLRDGARTLRRAWLQLGTVRIQYDQSRSHRYRFRNSSDESRTLVLEQPRGDKTWSLDQQAKALETTDTYYRFEVIVPAGKTAEFVVGEEREDEERFDLRDIDAKTLEKLSARKDLPPDVTASIREIRQLKYEIASLESKLKLQLQLLSDITKEQSRIRGNMSALDRDSDLYHRYVSKLTGQEDKFDAARETIAITRKKLADLGRQLARFFPSTKTIENQDADPFGDG